LARASFYLRYVPETRRVSRDKRVSQLDAGPQSPNGYPHISVRRRLPTVVVEIVIVRRHYCDELRGLSE